VELAPIFVSNAPEALRAHLSERPDLEKTLQDCLEAAQAEWPEVTLALDRYVAHLATHVPENAAGNPLDGMHTADMYLACACAAGDEAATRTFTTAYLDTIRAVIGRSAPQAVDDVSQRVLAGLLAGDAPSIRTFGGRSSLRSWLRVVATRAVYAHAKREKRHVGDDLDAIADRIDADTDDPEIEQLKRRYRAEFKRGFAHAFDRLDVRERNLLRHEHLDGLGVGEMATLYDVHRATITRWRNDARAKLLSETRKFFRQEVKLDGKEFESVLRLIESQLDVSLTRLLRGKRGRKE
jgi:RNA polymerase sigma-70 factor (ECF subfamily)